MGAINLFFLLVFASIVSCKKKEEAGITKIFYIRHSPLLLETAELIVYDDTVKIYSSGKKYIVAIPVFADDAGTPDTGFIDLGPTKSIKYHYLIANKGESRGLIVDQFHNPKRRIEVKPDSVLKSLGIGILDLSLLNNLTVLDDSTINKENDEVCLKYHFKKPSVEDGDSAQRFLSKLSDLQNIASISSGYDSLHKPYRLVKFLLIYNSWIVGDKIFLKREMRIELIQSKIDEVSDKEILKELKRK
jgi:hypothetical protein